MTFSAVDLTDVQGLVRYGYDDLKEACYFVLRITDPAAARDWLAHHKVTSVAEDRSPATVLQVAFTFSGLEALGVSHRILHGFPYDFRSGMTGDEARSRRLGDVGPNDPKGWHWGGPGCPSPHLLVTLCAKRPPGLQAFKATVQDALWKRAFEELACLSTTDMGRREPFGFADGLSQPKLDWGRNMPVRVRNTRNYTNMSALGEFLLGYPNEYARYTDRPLLDRKDDPADILLPAEDVPGKKDFARNGTYLVFRDLAQDVTAFRTYVGDPSGRVPGKQYTLAEAMVGRTKDGEPIVSPESQPIEGVGKDDRRSVRFHRLVRRGREYGPLTGDDAGQKRTVDEQGLRFVCLNANILRQFEFVQNSWIANPKFDGLDEADPLLGNREPQLNKTPTDTFTCPQENGAPQRFCGLPVFVTVRGGAYFFMPGLRTLRYICSL